MTIFKSRTFWTLVVTCLFNILDAYSHLIDPTIAGVINLVLLTVASYYHVNPSQTYTPPTPPAV